MSTLAFLLMVFFVTIIIAALTRKKKPLSEWTDEEVFSAYKIQRKFVSFPDGKQESEKTKNEIYLEQLRDEALRRSLRISEESANRAYETVERLFRK